MFCRRGRHETLPPRFERYVIDRNYQIRQILSVWSRWIIRTNYTSALRIVASVKENSHGGPGPKTLMR